MDQRDWEDSLFAAEAERRIGEKALLLGLRVSRLVSWGTPAPGLYWQGEGLYEALRVSRTTFYRLRGDLLAAGLVLEDRGNLFPVSPKTGTGSPKTGTGSPKTGTGSPKTGTYKSDDDVDDAHRAADHQIWAGRKALVISGSTTSAEIADTFPGPERFPERAAATFVALAAKYWPEATRPRFSVLVRLFTDARARYPEETITAGLSNWVVDNRDSDSIRSPGALFSKQAEEMFQEAQPLPATKEAHP